MASPVKDAKLKTQQTWAGATIHRRGKGSIVHQHPTSLDRFMADHQVGNVGWHFGDGPFTDAHEVDTAWVDAHPIDDAPWQKKMVLADYNAYAFREATHQFDQGQLIEYRDPVSGEAVAFQPQELEWTNDLDQISQISAPAAVAATIDDDMLTWADAYGSGIDFQWQTQTARLMKYVNIASLADLGSPPQFIIDGGNPLLRVELLFQKSANTEIWVDGVLWDEKSNNPQETANHVEFRLDGQPIWWFRAPRAWDSSGDEQIYPTMRLRKTAINLFIEILTPWSWLETATYPLTVDATIEPVVGASTDDAIEYATGNMQLTNGTNVSNSTGEVIGMRWTGVTIPDGVTIDIAYINVYVDDSPLRDDAHHTIDFEDGSATSTFTLTLNDITGRTGTTQTVAWNEDNVGAGVEDTPSIVAIIQELEDSYDYSGGSSMVARLDWATGGNLGLFSYDESSSYGALLHIEYTEATGDKSIEPTPEAVTVGDTATITPLILADVSETEDVTVGDTATIEALIIDISESEAVTVGDSAALSPVAPTDIDVSDGVTVTDLAPVVNIPSEEEWNISEQDDITVGESVTVDPVSPVNIDVSDGVTVTDIPTVVRTVEGEWYVSESENITVGESVTVDPVSPIDISESEAVTVGDTATVVWVGETTYYISESDGVVVGDSAVLGPVTPTEISEIEAVTVVDTPTVSFFQPILTLSTLDAVTVVDTAYVSFPTEFIGKGPPKKKPSRRHDPGRWKEEELPAQWREPQPSLATQQAQRAKRNQDERIRLKSEAKERDLSERAYRTEVAEMVLKQDQDRTRQREIQAKRMINLNKAKAAKAVKQKAKDDVNKTRSKNLKKARAAKKRKAKKK